MDLLRGVLSRALHALPGLLALAIFVASLPAHATDWVSTAKSAGSVSGGTCADRQRDFDNASAPPGVDAYKKAFWQTTPTNCGYSSAVCPGFSLPPAGYVFDHAEWSVSSTSGVNYNASKCVYTNTPPPACPDATNHRTVSFITNNYSTPASFCDGQCLWNSQGDLSICLDQSDGSSKCYQDYVGASATCDVLTPNANSQPSDCGANAVHIGNYCYPTTPDGGCPSGTSAGEVDGHQVCVGGDNQGGGDKNPKPTPAPGAKGTCDPSTDGAQCTADPSDPTKGTCDLSAGDFCTADPSDPTNQDQPGAGTGTCDPATAGASCTPDPSDPTKGTCNPNIDANCSPKPPDESKNSWAGGTCTADSMVAPSCSALNPVECGILLQSFYDRCQAYQQHEQAKGTAAYNAGDSLLSDADANSLKTDSRDVSGLYTGLDASGSGFGAGAASCPPDPVVNLPFGSFTFPVHYLCDLADYVRPLIIALGYFSAALIIFGFLREK